MKTVTVSLTYAQAVWIETLLHNAARLPLDARGTKLTATTLRAIVLAHDPPRPIDPGS